MPDPEYTPLTADDLAAYVGARGDADTAFVASCWARAVVMVDEACTDVDGAAISVPVEIKDGCYLGVGSELFHQRQAPNGISQFASGDGSAIRVARDPMVAAWAQLRPYIGLGVG